MTHSDHVVAMETVSDEKLRMLLEDLEGDTGSISTSVKFLTGVVSELLASRLAKQGSALPQDVITLVIAAREMFDLGYDPGHAEANALDQALDAFSSRVPYENQPDDEAPSPVLGEPK